MYTVMIQGTPVLCSTTEEVLRLIEQSTQGDVNKASKILDSLISKPGDISNQMPPASKGCPSSGWCFCTGACRDQKIGGPTNDHQFIGGHTRSKN